jgi:outer membrane lipopolysaccharide assembly protein LptE/RlpB
MKTCYPLLVTVLTAAVLLSTTGCTGYKLGSMLPDDIKTVYIPTFVNETDEPTIIGETTRAVKEAIQIDGSLEIASSESQADSILEVTLKEYTLTPVSYERDARTTPNQYRINLNASIRLVRTDNGQTIVQYPLVQGDANFDFAADLTTAKRQALPAVSRDLAHDIVELVVEYWQ